VKPGRERRTLFTIMAALAGAVASFLKKRFSGTRGPQAMDKEEASFKPIPTVSYVREETVTEIYTQIKDEIAELFKRELSDLDKEDDSTASEADLEANF
jgi:hypothetical protein